MTTLQKLGGLAALYEAAAYIVGMIGLLAVVDVAGVADPVQQVALMAANQAFLYTLHVAVYVVWGGWMIVLTLALSERLKAGPPAMVRTATVFGLLWGGVIMVAGMVHNVGMGSAIALLDQAPVQAGTLWLTVSAVLGGLAGANEAIGGVWILLMSWAAWRIGALPKGLNALGAAIGVAGLLSIVPALAETLIYVFALGQIGWFVWLGGVLLAGAPRRAA